MDTYSGASTWPLPPLLPASTHAVPTHCSEKARGKETVMSLFLAVSHTKDNTEHNQDYSKRERCTSSQHCSYYYSNSRVSTTEALCLLSHKSSITPYKEVKASGNGNAPSSPSLQTARGHKELLGSIPLKAQTNETTHNLAQRQGLILSWPCLKSDEENSFI